MKKKLDISVAFAPALDTPDHIALAEQFGYARAWCYDGPAIWADVWMTLARAADRTRRIGLGTAVLVPSYRHVMSTAAAIATLAGLAPGRVAAGIGVGHGNRMMGGDAMPWQQTARYIETLRALLKGEDVEHDGSLAHMMHNPRCVAPRPVDVPILVAAQGPKGLDVARKLADGVITAVVPNAGFAWSSVLLMGTVLPDDGSIDAEKIMDAAGPGAAVVYHTSYNLDWKNGPAFAQIPNADKWTAALEKNHAAARRHLAAWCGHLVKLTDEDKVALTPDLVRQITFTGTAAELRTRLDGLQSGGATEVIYQPAGADIPGELRRFAAMAGL
jgi:5,10-methylenetetrahydromethanopterin reductase